MQSMTTIDLPLGPNARTRYHTYRNHVSFVLYERGHSLLLSADDPETIATWLEGLAAQVRVKSFDADVSAATLSAVQGDHVGEGVADDGA